MQGESSLVLFWIFMRLTGALKSKEVDETRGVFVHVLAGFTWRVAGSTLQLQGESSLVLFWICETAAALKSKERWMKQGVCHPWAVDALGRQIRRDVMALFCLPLQIIRWGSGQ